MNGLEQSEPGEGARLSDGEHGVDWMDYGLVGEEESAIGSVKRAVVPTDLIHLNHQMYVGGASYQN